eukprot:TRINITY_DN6571_c0_g1_i1.p1 TRINITY_DN6571_c0_g1~~TRINITY_DN6571_c0_g1_i1.p1  ORF type:complete len:1237 (+),score=135.80 TRINITY_DN6571_c0_g1_i1:106-3816(+)
MKRPEAAVFVFVSVIQCAFGAKYFVLQNNENGCEDGGGRLVGGAYNPTTNKAGSDADLAECKQAWQFLALGKNLGPQGSLPGSGPDPKTEDSGAGTCWPDQGDPANFCTTCTCSPDTCGSGPNGPRCTVTDAPRGCYQDGTPNGNLWYNIGTVNLMRCQAAAVCICAEKTPTASPSAGPSASPVGPSKAPSLAPSRPPSISPSAAPAAPTRAPSVSPTGGPVLAPTAAPTGPPSAAPLPPTKGPSGGPVAAPTGSPRLPSSSPAAAVAPSTPPTAAPTAAPAKLPTAPPQPAGTPTAPPQPAVAPTAPPQPAGTPTAPPRPAPSAAPTVPPSLAGSPTAPPGRPSAAPSSAPLPPGAPTRPPAVQPSGSPTTPPEPRPSAAPSAGSPPSPSPSTAPATPAAPTAPPAAPTAGPAAPAAPTAGPAASVRPTDPSSPSPTTSPLLTGPVVLRWSAPSKAASEDISSSGVVVSVRVIGGRFDLKRWAGGANPPVTLSTNRNQAPPLRGMAWALREKPLEVVQSTAAGHNASVVSFRVGPVSGYLADAGETVTLSLSAAAVQGATSTTGWSQWKMEVTEATPTIAEQTQAIAGGVAAASAVLGAGSAGPAQNLLMITSMGCKDENADVPPTMHPLGISIDNNECIGAFVGNLAVLVCGVAVVHFLSALILREVASMVRIPVVIPAAWFTGNKQWTVRQAQGVLRFPAFPLFMYMFCYQGNAWCAFKVLFKADSPVHVIAAAIVLIILLAAPGLLGWMLHRATPDRMLFRTDRQPESKCLRWLVGPGEWVSVDREWPESWRYSLQVWTYTARCCYFIFAEFLFQFLSGMAAAIPTGGNYTTCGHVRVLLLTFTCSFVAVEIIMQPHSRPRDNWFDSVRMIVTSVGFAFEAAGYYRQGAGHDSQALLSVGQACMSAALLVILLKVVLDGLAGLWSAVRGRRNRMQAEVWEQKLSSPQRLPFQEDESFIAGDHSWQNLLSDAEGHARELDELHHPRTSSTTSTHIDVDYSERWSELIGEDVRGPGRSISLPRRTTSSESGMAARQGSAKPVKRAPSFAPYGGGRGQQGSPPSGPNRSPTHSHPSPPSPVVVMETRRQKSSFSAGSQRGQLQNIPKRKMRVVPPLPPRSPGSPQRRGTLQGSASFQECHTPRGEQTPRGERSRGHSRATAATITPTTSAPTVNFSTVLARSVDSRRKLNRKSLQSQIPPYRPAGSRQHSFPDDPARRSFSRIDSLARTDESFSA